MIKDYKFFNIPIIVYIFFLALFLRLYNLGVPSIWVDEAFSIWIAEAGIHTLLTNISMDAHPPLYFILLHYWIKLFGNSEFAARLLSVIFGLAAIIVTYKFCNEIFNDKKYGLLAAFLLSISSYSIIFTDTDVKMYSQLMFLTMLSTYVLYKALKEESFYLWALYVIVSILNIYTHYFSFFVILSHIIYILVIKPDKDGIKRVLYPAFIFLISFIFWSNSFFKQIFVFRRGEHLGKAGVINFMGLVTDLFSTIYFKMPAWIVYIFTALILILLVKGILVCLRHKNSKIIPLIFGVVVFTPFLISFISGKHIFQSRYFSLIHPLFLILLACGILSFRNKFIKCLVILIFILFNLSSYYLYATDSRYWKQDWRTVAKYVEEKSKSGDLVLMQISYNIFPFNYYYKNNLLRFGLKATSEAGSNFSYALNYTEEYLKKGGVRQDGIDVFSEKQLNLITYGDKRVIYILNMEKYYDPQRKVLKWFNKNFDFIEGAKVESFNYGQSDISIGIFSKKSKK